MFGWGKKSDSPLTELWSWVERHHATLRPESPAFKRSCAEFSKRLQAIHSELAWEGRPTPDGGVQIAISANGLHDVAHYVHRLIATAPKVEGVTFVAFRQPSPKATSVQMGGRTIRVDHLCIVALGRTARGKFGLRLGSTTGFDPTLESVWMDAAVVLIDNLIGEEAAMTWIERLEFATPARCTGRPLSDLPSLIEDWKKT